MNITNPLLWALVEKWRSLETSNLQSLGPAAWFDAKAECASELADILAEAERDENPEMIRQAQALFDKSNAISDSADRPNEIETDYILNNSASTREEFEAVYGSTGDSRRAALKTYRPGMTAGDLQLHQNEWMKAALAAGLAAIPREWRVDAIFAIHNGTLVIEAAIEAYLEAQRK